MRELHKQRTSGFMPVRHMLRICRIYRMMLPLLVWICVAGAVGAQTAGPSPDVRRNIEYARLNDEPLRLDLYRPTATPGPWPVILWVHGGGWETGNKEACPAAFLVKAGYAVASINYRLSQQAIFPAQIEDCKAAVRWLRAHAAEYSLAPEHIGVWGVSAGGHLAALLGTSGGVKALEGTGNLNYSSRVQAVCDFFGPTDFLHYGSEPTGYAMRVVTALLGGRPEEKRELATLASPLTHITRDDPPFLIMHGDRDALVPLAQSQALYDALRKAGVNATLEIVPNAGHGFNAPTIAQQVLAFFDKHLKGAGK